MFLPPRFRLILGIPISVLAWLAFSSTTRGDHTSATPPNQPAATGTVAQPIVSAPAGPDVPIEQVIAKMQELALQHPGQPMKGKFVQQFVTGAGRVDDFEGNAAGANARGKGGKDAPAGVTGTVPAITTPTVGAYDKPGGTGAGKYTAQANPENDTSSPWWANPLFYAGLLCFVVAIALFTLPKIYPIVFPKPIDPKIPTGIAGLGAAFEVAVFWPAVLVFAVIGGVIWLLGPTVLHAIQTAQDKAKSDKLMSAGADKINTLTEGMRAAADGIAKLPDAPKTLVLNSIAGEAEAQHGDHQTIESHVDPTLQPFRIPRESPKSAAV